MHNRYSYDEGTGIAGPRRDLLKASLSTRPVQMSEGEKPIGIKIVLGRLKNSLLPWHGNQDWRHTKEALRLFWYQTSLCEADRTHCRWHQTPREDMITLWEGSGLGE